MNLKSAAAGDNLHGRALIISGILLLQVACASAQTGQGEANGVALPGSAGSLSYNVDSQSGRFVYQIPIMVPPARQGAQPKLQLGYSSGSPNGWCGVGWSLDIGQIDRDTRNGPPIAWDASSAKTEYDDAKGFVFSMAGASGRLVPTARTDEYRLEIQTTRLLLNLYRSTNTWVVTDSGGNKFYFGQSDGTRMRNMRWTGTGVAQTYRWALDQVIDVNGNKTVITWQKDGRLLYPQSIDYNGHTNQPALGQPIGIVFGWERRPDTNWTFRAGDWVEQSLRLKSITNQLNTTPTPTPVSRYEIGYHLSPATHRSMLGSVTNYGSDNVTAFPPVTFQYNEPSLELGDITNWTRQTSSPDMAYISANATNNDTSYTLLDLNGDGLPDRVWRQRSGPAYSWMIEASTGSGFSAAATFSAIDTTSACLDLSSYTDTQKAPYAGFGALSDTTGGGTQTRYHVTYELAIDINGDGRVDRFVCDRLRLKQYVQLNTGSGLSALTEWTNVAESTDTFKGSGIATEAANGDDTDSILMLIDMNGDGKPDRLYLDNGTCYIQFNTGFGWANAVTWAGLTGTYITRIHRTALDTSHTRQSQTVATLVDINGDGLPDHVTCSGGYRWTIRYNQGDGFAAPCTFAVAPSDDHYPESFSEYSYNGEYSRSRLSGMVDWNGDGLPDRQDNYIFSYNEGLYFSVNPKTLLHNASAFYLVPDGPEPSDCGPTWTVRPTADSTIPDFLEVRPGRVGQAQRLDINGDGLPDAVFVFNAGAYWVYKDGPPATTAMLCPGTNPPAGLVPPTLQVQLTQGKLPDLLTRVVSPLGGSVSITYVPSSSFANVNGSGVALLPMPFYVVNTVTVDDGFGNLATKTYSFSGGYFDGPTREFRGFHKVEETDPVGMKTATYFHQGGGYDGSSLGEYQDGYAKKGMPYQIEVYGTDGALVHRTLNKIEVAQPETGVPYYFPYLSQAIKMDFADATHYRATAEQLTYNPATGNAILSYNLGEVSGVDAATHTFTDLDATDAVRTETAYHSFTGNLDIVNKPELVTVSKADLTEPHKTQFGYDGHGNLTSTSVWLAEGSRWVSRGQVTYDSLGNPVSSTDAAGVLTETTYDSTYQTFPVSRTVAPRTGLAMTTSTTFDARSGNAIQTTSPLGVITRTDYDTFYRPTAAYINEGPNQPANLWRTRTDYYLNGMSGTTSNNKIYHRAYDVNDTVNGIETFTYLDGLGRSIQVRVEGETNNVYRCTDVFHDDSSRDSFAPYPYYGSGSAYSPNTGQQKGTYTQYDTVGRVSSITPAAQAAYNANRQRQGVVTLTAGDAGSPVAAATTAYVEGADPWVTITTDPELKITKAYRNAFGRMTQIINVTSQGNISTGYGYDLVGNLRTVTDDSSHVTTVTYDSLSRKTSITDPDMGYWHYQYDDADRLIDQYDAKNQHQHFAYESASGATLGRTLSKQVYDAAGGLKHTVSYIWDVSPESGCTVYLGQLAEVKDTTTACNCVDNKRFWSYDYKGRALAEGVYSWAFGTFTTTSTYNDADQLDQLNYPNDVARLKYTYGNGMLQKVQSLKGTGSRSEIFYQLTSLNEFGQPIAYSTHNGQVTNQREFYDNSRRLKTLSTFKGSTDILKKSYTFDKVSNVKGITDGVAAHTGAASGTVDNLQYDDLHRLTGLHDASATRSYAYDKLGNLTANGDLPSGGGNYSYDPARPHAVISANGNNYGYDANGNMTARKGQALTYDEENRLTRVTATGLDVNFGYDYQGTRLWKYNKNNNQYACFVSPLFEYRESDAAGLCYVYADGQRIAAFRPTADVYAVLGPPSLHERFMASLGRASRTADRGLGWAFSPSRVQETSWTLAVLFTLALLLATRRWAGIKLAKSERRFYYQPLCWRGLAFALIPALLFATAPVQAAFVPGEVFYYYHTDHLGSSNITTDRSGNVVQQHEYRAYGTERNVVNNADGHPEYDLTHGFTGQILDADTGLYFYGSRYYDPEISRFVQADTVVPSPGDPQTLNRYSYCGNNPLKYVDPSGHIFGVDDVIIGFVIGMVVGGISAAVTGGNVFMGALTGAMTGALGALGATLGGIPAAVLLGATGGALNAAITGGDIGRGALTGAVAGGISYSIGRLTQTALARYASLKVYSFANTVIRGSVGGAAGGAVAAAINDDDIGTGALSGGLVAAAESAAHWEYNRSQASRFLRNNVTGNVTSQVREAILDAGQSPIGRELMQQYMSNGGLLRVELEAASPGGSGRGPHVYPGLTSNNMYFDGNVQNSMIGNQTFGTLASGEPWGPSMDDPTTFIHELGHTLSGFALPDHYGNPNISSTENLYRAWAGMPARNDYNLLARGAPPDPVFSRGFWAQTFHPWF